MLLYDETELIVNSIEKVGHPPRDYQAKAIKSLCDGNDLVCIAPAPGKGKSYMFDFTSLLLDDSDPGMLISITP
jgi:superfamily II DNA/RNA helicase